MYGDQWFKDYKARLKQDVPRDDLYAHKVSPDENVRTKRDQNTAINEYQNQKGTFLDNISPYREPTIDVLRTTNNRNSDVSKVRVSTEENLVSRNLYTKLEDRYPKRLSTYEKLHNNRQKTRYTDLSAYRESTVVEEVKPIRQKTKFTDLSEYRESTCDDNVPFRQKDKFRDLSPCRISTEDNMSDMIDDVKMLDLGAYGESKVVEKVKPIRQKTKFTENDIPKEKEPYSCGQHEIEDIRIVLLGRTGSGKSATGNTILTKKKFISKASGSSVTEQCQIAENSYACHRYVVVDTPGLFDTKLTDGEITREIIRCIHMSTPGPHAFLLVLRLDRFTQEEIDTFSRLFDLFGEQMSSYAIIVFTRFDDLEVENTTIEEFIDGSGENLKQFIKKVEGRYIAFNNRGKEGQKRKQIENLNKSLEAMIQKNGGKHYTNKMYKEADENMQQKIMEVKRAKELEKQREVEEIESKFKSQMSMINTNNKLLESEIRKQKVENANIEAEKIKTQSMMQDIQGEMTKMSSVHQKQLYEARQEAKKMEEEKLRELRIQEEKNRRQYRIMNRKWKEAENRMQMLEHERQEALDDQRHNFQSAIEQNMKDVNYTAQFGDLLYNSKQQTESLIETNNELRKSLEESRLKNQQTEERNRKHMKQMEETVENLQRNMKRKDREMEYQKTQSHNNKSCLLM